MELTKTVFQFLLNWCMLFYIERKLPFINAENRPDLGNWEKLKSPHPKAKEASEP